MRRIMPIALVLVLLTVMCSCGKTAPTWQEQYDLGIRYLSEGNYEEAVSAFTAAIEIDPKQAPAYVGRGDAYVGLGETEGNLAMALADYQQAIELDETAAEVYKKAAEIYVLLGDTDAAVELLKRGIALTGDENLQTYLDELISSPLTVLTYQAAYKPDGTLISFKNYYYDEQGYMIRQEWTHINSYDGSATTRITTWTFDVNSGLWTRVPDRMTYDTDEEWEAAKEKISMEPGTSFEWTGSFGVDYSVCVDPLIHTDQDNVKANNDILNSDGSGDWSYAVYSFDDSGYPVAISTYHNEELSGTAVLTWSTIETTAVKK